MKGLVPLPSSQDLQSCQTTLNTQSTISLQKLCLFIQYSRFDPRLAAGLVTYFSRHWSDVNPVELNKEILAQPWPQAMCVILEFLKKANAKNSQYSAWMDCATHQIANSNHEQFFIGLRAFGGKLMGSDAEHGSFPYKKWGYLGKEMLLDKTFKKNKTFLSKNARQQLLKTLIASRARFTVSDYLAWLDNQVSRRQGELDLKQSPKLRAMGKTKSKIYIRK